MVGDQSPFSNLRPGYSLLTLSCTDRPGQVHLACAEDRDSLDVAVRRLGTFLGAAQNQTHVPVAAADGSTFDVDRTPFGRKAVSPASLRLQLPSPHLAVFRRELPWPLIEFLLVGVPILLTLLAVGGSLHALIPFLIGAALLGVVAVAAMRSGRRTVVADLEGGLISLGKRGRRIPIEEVAALQTCLYYSAGGESSWTFREVNLVLRRPPGERVNMLNDPDKEAAAADARRFAEFLGVPLLDHTTPGAAPPATGRRGS